MRQKLRDLPIARKLGLLLAFNTTIAVVAIALVFSIGTAITRYQEARDQLVALSEVMGETSRAALAFNDQDGARAGSGDNGFGGSCAHAGVSWWFQVTWYC